MNTQFEVPNASNDELEEQIRKMKEEIRLFN